MKIRIHGDWHGKYEKGLPLLIKEGLNIHVGDLGFNYNPVTEYIKKEDIQLVLNEGNHDNYAFRAPFKLLDYGMNSIDFQDNTTSIPNFGFFQFFNVRGAHSIDWMYREMKLLTGEWPKTWWSEEEISVPELEKAINLYERLKPNFIITHEAPRSVIHNVTDGRVLKEWNLDPETFTTRTSDALDAMFKIHQPKHWVFGHYHRHTEFIVNNTNFLCLAELDYKDF